MYDFRGHCALHQGNEIPVVFALSRSHPHASPLIHECLGQILDKILDLKSGVSTVLFSLLEGHFVLTPSQSNGVEPADSGQLARWTHVVSKTRKGKGGHNG